MNTGMGSRAVCVLPSGPGKFSVFISTYPGFISINSNYPTFISNYPVFISQIYPREQVWLSGRVRGLWLKGLGFRATSTFSPVGSRSSNGMRMCVCVCVDGMNLKYALRWHIHISVHSVLCLNTGMGSRAVCVLPSGPRKFSVSLSTYPGFISINNNYPTFISNYPVSSRHLRTANWRG